MRALEKDPQARFQSMAELALALESVPAIGQLDMPAANQRPERTIDPSMTDLELPSLSDHDLRSEAPMERLIGSSAKHSIGMRWSMVAAAACALMFAGASALDRQQATPSEAAQTVQTSALVSPLPTPARVAPPITAAAPRTDVPAQLPTSLPPTMPEHAIAVVAPSDPPKTSTKSWRRASARRVAEPAATADLSGAGLPAPELVEPSAAATTEEPISRDDAIATPSAAEADTAATDDAAVPEDGAATDEPIAPVQRPTTPDPFAPSDPAGEIKDPFESP